jgi:hypothetical protein
MSEISVDAVEIPTWEPKWLKFTRAMLDGRVKLDCGAHDGCVLLP